LRPKSEIQHTDFPLDELTLSFLTELFLVGIAIAREFIGQFKQVESSWLTSSRGWGMYDV
jgi:hypothetical protein